MTCPKCKTRMHLAMNSPEAIAHSCRCCGNWIEFQRIVKPMTAAIKPPLQKNINRPAMRPCPVEGCSGRLRLDSEQRMCRDCIKLLYDWSRGAKTLLPPIMEVDGRLVRRGCLEKEAAA